MDKTSFLISAGIRHRGEVRRGLEAFCKIRGLDLHLVESKSVLSSLFTVNVSGRTKDIQDLVSVVRSIER